jgi:hypothetical protein
MARRKLGAKWIHPPLSAKKVSSMTISLLALRASIAAEIQ